MDSLGPLVDLYNNIDIFLLIIARMAGFFIMIPVFAGRNVPMTAKIGLAAAIGAIAFSSGNVTLDYTPNLIGYGLLLVSEFAVGLVIAFVVYMMFSIFYFVGQIVDYQIGFSMVSVFDPVTQIQVPITGNLYYLVISMLFVVTNGVHQMVQTVFYSYDAIPIGGARFIDNAALIVVILEMIVNFFIIGVKVALPVIATILIVDVSLGILVKAVPQMNIFVVGMPIKLFIGLIVLYVMFPIFIGIYDFLFNETLVYVYNIIRGMMSSP